ncbi:MAG: hypothetical protein GY953_24335 [bacterium]|nr:hypothetical protein [bacterium]
MLHGSQITRRHLLAGLGGLAFGNEPKKTVAAIITEFRHRSHADVICTRFFDGYYPNGRRQEPRTRIVSMFTDQVPSSDMSRGLAQRYRYQIYPTVAEALTLGGSNLAVDAVLLIGEHGDYPTNSRGQKLYPRHRLFEQIIEVFRRTGRAVPVFCDKHLSYSWPKAKQMYDWAQELAAPFMAGSSIPVTVRSPELEIPYGAKLKRVVQTGYGGTDSYGFHTLEAMQCMVERRAGGETGVASVEMVEGERVWRWRDSEAGRWSVSLLNDALSRSPTLQRGRMEDNSKQPVLFVVKYRDGLEAAVYMLNGHSSSWTFATEIEGRTVSTHFGQIPQTRDLPHFDGLTHAIEELFVTGQPLYRVERTLLTTGILAFLFDSKERKGAVETPELAVRYQAPEDTFFQRS